LNPADLEALALRAIATYPALIAEVGLEFADFIDPERKEFFRSLRETKRFLSDGRPVLTDVADRAGLGRDWVLRHIQEPIALRPQAREYVRQLREYSIGERFSREVAGLAKMASGLDLIRQTQAAAQKYALMAASGEDVVTLKDAALRFADVQQQRISERRPMGPSTGLPTIDRAIKGWRPGELTILVAPASAGKSTLAQFFCLQVARQGLHTITFSGEMTHDQSGERMLYAECGVPMSENLDNMDRIQAATVRLRGNEELSRMHIDHRSSFSPARTRSVVEFTKATKGSVGLVVGDHLRHIEGSGGREDYIRLASSAQEGKNLATDTGCAVLLLAHMNAESFKELGHGNGENGRQGDNKPRLSMLRGGPLIHDVVDNMLCLWCPQTLPSLTIWKTRQGGRAWSNREVNLTFDILTQAYGEVL
jgi:replicative DNA helicase